MHSLYNRIYIDVLHRESMEKRRTSNANKFSLSGFPKLDNLYHFE